MVVNLWTSRKLDSLTGTERHGNAYDCGDYNKSLHFVQSSYKQCWSKSASSFIRINSVYCLHNDSFNIFYIFALPLFRVLALLVFCVASLFSVLSSLCVLSLFSHISYKVLQGYFKELTRFYTSISLNLAGSYFSSISLAFLYVSFSMTSSN